MKPEPANAILTALTRSRGTMSDAAIEMSYQEIATAVHQTAAILDDHGIGAADGVAFACGNDLPSATVLLTLLVSERSFILLPPADPSIGQDVDAAMPATFCRYRLHLRGRQDATGTAVPAMADNAIVVSPNPNWRASLPAGPAGFFVPTSGSTARAKLVRHRHDRLLRAAESCAERLRLVPADRVALPVPIAHMFGLGAAFLPGVLAGASIDLQSGSNALRYFARERQFDPTVAFLTPSFGDTLLRLRKAPRPYRLTVMAGDRLIADLFDRTERLHGCAVNLYGSTELGVIAAGDPRDPAPVRRDSIGRLMQGVTILHHATDPAPNAERAADADADADADILWFQHACGFEGYTDAHGRTMREPDGSLASGDRFCSNDIGRLVDGYLVVQGRADDLVNRDGILVACADIAAAIRSIGGIADAAVLTGAMSRRGRALIAFCVAVADTRWEIAALRKACLEILQPRAVPDEFLFVSALPRLPSGKVDRLALHRRTLVDESDSGETGTNVDIR